MHCAKMGHTVLQCDMTVSANRPYTLQIEDQLSWSSNWHVAMHLLGGSVHCQLVAAHFTSPSQSSGGPYAHTRHCTPWRSQHMVHFAGFGISHLQRHESVKRVNNFVNSCRGSVVPKHLIGH